MNALAHFDALESALHPTPLFPVESPDGVRTWSEIARQSSFIKDMRQIAPKVIIYANANAGKRNPAQARLEGVVGGVFDLTCAWHGGVAWPEFKGYDKGNDGKGVIRKRLPQPGTLSDAQIEWGNRMHQAGHSVAAFFSPLSCIEWIRSLGAPFIDRPRS